MSTSGTNLTDARLWMSENPRYGVVRHVVTEGPFAAQFDDLNSDYREVCLNIFGRTARGWELLLSQDDVGLPASDVAVQYGGYPHSWAVGRDEPGALTTVRWEHEEQPVRAGADGWWLFAWPWMWEDDIE